MNNNIVHENCSCNKKTILFRSHCVVISSCLEKNQSLQLFQKKFVFIISFLCFFFSFENCFSQKSSSKKWCSWEKKLLLSPLDFSFFLKKLFSIFQLSWIFFCACCVFLFFCFFCSVFLVFSSFFEFFQPKIYFNRSHLKKYCFFNFLLNFFERGKILWTKKRRVVLFKKISFEFSKLFQDPHALRIACAIEGSLDHCCVSWRSWASQVHVHSVVIDLGCGAPLASCRLSPLFFSAFFEKKGLFCFF